MSDESTDEEIEEMDPDLLDEDMGEEIEIDLESDDLAEDEDDDNKEVPSGARPSTEDEDDEDEDDEVEADLDTILKERLSSTDEDDEDEEEEEEEGVITTAEGDRIPGKQEDEILCEGCFLLVKESQYDHRDSVPICPHCGTPLNV